MEIRVLKYFLAVARFGNITKAAEELHLTQPTLSRQLTDLENELGCQLFVRGKRHIVLTEAGSFLQARAQEIIQLADKTTAQLARNDELIAGDIYIGCGETEAMREVTAALAKVRKNYPQIRFHLVSGNEASITDKLQKGLLDFGLVCRETPPVEYVYRRLNYQDTWGLLMKGTNPLASREAVTRADLLREPLIISRQLLESQEFDHWLNCSVKKLHIVGSYNLLHNTVFLAEQDFGSVLCFDRIVPQQTLDYGQLIFRPLTPVIHSANYLIWRKEQVFSRAGQLVKSCFDEAFLSSDTMPKEHDKE